MASSSVRAMNDDLEKAVHIVQTFSMPRKLVAVRLGVAASTLKRHLDRTTDYVRKRGQQPLLLPEEEKKLLDLISLKSKTTDPMGREEIIEEVLCSLK